MDTYIYIYIHISIYIMAPRSLSNPTPRLQVMLRTLHLETNLVNLYPEP